MADLSIQELDEIYAFAVDLGKKAGKMLMDAAQLRMAGSSRGEKEKEHVQKENAVDLVTETDEGMCEFWKLGDFDWSLSTMYLFV